MRSKFQPAHARPKSSARGTVYANLAVERKGVQPTAKINEPVLGAVLSTLKSLAGKVDAAPATWMAFSRSRASSKSPRKTNVRRTIALPRLSIVAAFEQALTELIAMRRAEGATLGKLLSARLNEIAALTARAEKAPGRKPEAIKTRLAEQVATLMSASERFDIDRLHQEAILIAAKADIREELDRLSSHVGQAKKLLAEGGAIGRKLDFLAQELHRESNTLTAKANEVELTNIGLELKSVIEQFREQVQNLE